MSGKATPVRFGNYSVSTPVTAVNAQIDPSISNPAVYRLIASVDIHVALNRNAATTDAKIVADTVEYVSLGTDDVLNFIRANGAIDGTVWLTEIK